MTALLITISLVLSLMILEKAHHIRLQRINRDLSEREAKLSVLRVVAKHEAFFGGDREQFRDWLARLLKMQGYRKIEAVPLTEERGYDFACEKIRNQKIYVLCAPYDPSRFEEMVSLAEAQRLVGAMVGKKIKQGLIITTTCLAPETARYLENLPGGIKIETLDGDKLLQSLYDLRRVLLAPFLDTTIVS